MSSERPQPPPRRGSRFLSAMTATELRQWQRRCGLRTDEQAAAVLGMSVKTYRRKRSGLTPITKQTELLCSYYEIFGQRWLAIAEAAYKLSSLTRRPVAPAAISKTRQVIEAITDLDEDAA
jgi:hypothetical protein